MQNFDFKRVKFPSFFNSLSCLFSCAGYLFIVTLSYYVSYCRRYHTDLGFFMRSNVCIYGGIYREGLITGGIFASVPWQINTWSKKTSNGSLESVNLTEDTWWILWGRLNEGLRHPPLGGKQQFLSMACQVIRFYLLLVNKLKKPFFLVCRYSYVKSMSQF